MLRFLPLITGLLLTITVFGQSFSGIVKDKSTSEPIPYANIFFVELSSGTSTNNDGSFFIEHIPNHKIHVQISFIGYRTIIEEVDFSQINEKEFYLEESHIELEEVVVSVHLQK